MIRNRIICAGLMAAIVGIVATSGQAEARWRCRNNGYGNYGWSQNFYNNGYTYTNGYGNNGYVYSNGYFDGNGMWVQTNGNWANGVNGNAVNGTNYSVSRPNYDGTPISTQPAPNPPLNNNAATNTAPQTTSPPAPPTAPAPAPAAQSPQAGSNNVNPGK